MAADTQNLVRCKGLSLPNLELLLAPPVGSGLKRLGLLGSSIISDDNIGSITAACPNLRHLDLSWCTISDRGLAKVNGKRLPKLHTIHLKGCQIITDEGVRRLVKTVGRNLRLLDLFGCHALTDAAVRAIVDRCSRLVDLTLAECPLVSDASLGRAAGRLGALERLDLRGCKMVRPLRDPSASPPHPFDPPGCPGRP